MFCEDFIHVVQSAEPRTPTLLQELPEDPFPNNSDANDKYQFLT